MNSHQETYEYKGFSIKHYPIGKYRAVTEYRFDVYDSNGLFFSYIKGITDEALVIAASNGEGNATPGPETNEALRGRGQQAVHALIDNEGYREFERGHVVQDITVS